jgi:hypothetical protein
MPVKAIKPAKPFSSLTKGEQRVQIARDALKWIRKPNVKVHSGNYFKVTKGEDTIKVGDDLNQHLSSINCTVCAKGGLFIAHVDRFDRCKVPGYYYRSGPDLYSLGDEWSITKRLSSHFSLLQLDMIETAFEKRAINDHTNKLKSMSTERHTPLVMSCIKFGRQYKSAHDRLEAILKNIIKNKGTFKP